MKITRGLQFYTGSREEKIEGFTEEFPYIASRAELNAYQESFVPWHWHKAVELFYIESGTLTYHTPGGGERISGRIGRDGEFQCAAYDEISKRGQRERAASSHF